MASLALNVVLNLLLIEDMGARGCGLAAIISQGFCGIAAMIFANKRSSIDIYWRSMFSYFVVAALVAGLYFLAINKLDVHPWILVLSAGLFTLALAMQLKLINFKVLIGAALKKDEKDDQNI
jgi:peptidoglycan biosynthesis protein MviN/MurJ (putative lipid II flippase)